MARRNPKAPLKAGSFEEYFNKGYLDETVWNVSTYSAPGNNTTNTGTFSASNIDLSSGMLRLKLSQTGTAGTEVFSTGAEISTVQSYGYGTYEWVARMGSSASTPQAPGTNVSGGISGLFNYAPNSATEIDFELEGVHSRRDLAEMTSWVYAGIEYVGQSTGVNSSTLPTHQEHDVIVAFAFRDGSTTAPTVPAGWTTHAAPAGASGSSMVLAYKVAEDGSTTSGTWTNATSVVFQVYRGVNRTSPLGGVATASGDSTSVTYPSITITDTPDVTWQAPWVLSFSGIRSIDTSLETAPTGMTARSHIQDSTVEASGFDTDGEFSGDTYASQVVSVGGTAAGWHAVTVELRRQRNEATATTVPGLYSGFSHYKFVWRPSGITYFINNKQVAEHTSVVPSAACPVYINHWGTDNEDFGGAATPGIDRYLFVSYFRFTPYDYAVGEAWPVGDATPLPAKVLSTYFTAWDDTFAIDETSALYNQIYLFHATPAPALTGAFEFVYDYNVSQEAIQAARTAGRRVVLTCGGAGAGFAFTHRSQSTAFIESFAQMYADYGPFDGCDFNMFEAGVSSNTNELIWISDQLKRTYGSNFSITCPPHPSATYAPQDRVLFGDWVASGTLDYAAPQFYDDPSLITTAYIQDTIDEFVAIAEANGGSAANVMVGLGANYSNGSTTANSVTAYTAIETAHPTIRGAYGWNTQLDEADSYSFAVAMSAII